MSLLFEETFAGGTEGNFDATVDTLSQFSYAGGKLVMTKNATSAACYHRLLASASSYLVDPMRQAWAKFNFACSNTTHTSARVISLCGFINNDSTTNIPVVVRLLSDGSGNMTTLRLTYDDAASVQTNIDMTITDVSDAADHELEVFFSAPSTITSGDGIFIAYLDGSLVISQTNIQTHTAALIFDEFVLGERLTPTTATGSTVSWWNVRLSSNRNYTDETEDYYVDNVLGDDSNAGTVSAPFKRIASVTGFAKAGDTVTLVNNGPQYPYRVSKGSQGVMNLVRSGTAAAPITYNGNNAYLTNTIQASDTSRWVWNAAGTAGEYYLTRVGGTTPSFPEQPAHFLTCTSAIWTAQGIDGLTRRTEGTVDSLAAGEWDYGDSDTLGFSTVYYRPAAGESISDVHVEVSYGVASDNSSYVIYSTATYLNVKKFTIRYAHHSGIRDQGAGTGNIIELNNIQYSYVYGVHSYGSAAWIKRNSCTWALGSSGGGVACTNSSTSRVEANNCSYNYDDGIDVDGSTGVVTVGNLCAYNGSWSEGTDSCGIEVSSSGAADICNNVFYQNKNRQLSIDSNTAKRCQNNICFNPTGSAIGVWLGTGDGVALTFTTNCIFANGGTAQSGGAYSSTGDVLADPLLNDDYTLTESSPCVGTGTAWFTGKMPECYAGEPLSAFDTDIGFGTQFGPFHPVNL